MKCSVISSDGLLTRCTGAPKYHGTYMSPSYLEFSQFASPTPIAFAVGDYVDYTRTGLRYKLYSIPQPQRKASNGGSGESFVYSNVCFYAETKVLELAPFHDLAYEGSEYYFSSNKEFSIVTNVSGLADRLKANLNLYAGADTWRVVVQSGLSGYDETSDKTLTISGTCLNALQVIYDSWSDLGWTFSYVTEGGVSHPTITIGGANVRTSANTTQTYSYHAGITTLKRSQCNSDEFCTRLRVFGSTRNMPANWYNRQDICSASSVHIPNVMLPLSSWGTSGSPAKPDAQKAYLESSSAVSRYGVIERSVYFDGSDNDEIYPSISGTTIANVKAAKAALGKTAAGKPDYYPQESDGTKAVDVIDTVVSHPVDDGDTGTSDSQYIEDSSVALNYSGNLSSEGGLTLTVGTHTYSHGGSVCVKIDSPMTFGAYYSFPPDKPQVTYEVICGDRKTSTYHATVQIEQVGTWMYRFVAYFDSEVSLGDVAFPIESGSVVQARIYVTGGAANGSYELNSGNINWRMKKVLMKTFKVRLRQYGVDINVQKGTPTISMTSGACSAREFTVNKAEYESATDTWLLTLNRTTDSSLNKAFPNTDSPVAAGDHFVILGIEMPDEYITMASERLLTAGTALFGRCSQMLPLYEPALDSKWIAEQLASHPQTETYILREGKYMAIDDADLASDFTGHVAYVIIDSLTIAEDESNTPVYSVVLRDVKSITLKKDLSDTLHGVTVRIGNLEEEQSVQRTIIRDDGTSGLTDGERTALESALQGINAADERLVPANNIVTIPAACASSNGVITHVAQTIAGDKTFTGAVIGEQGISAKGICDLSVTSSGGGGGTSDYTDLENKPQVNGVTLLGNKTSGDLGVAAASHTHSASDITSGLANVATSGAYADLTGRPAIPGKTSDLTNDSGFITSSYHDSTKQDTLAAGDNITISGTTISATDTTYEEVSAQVITDIINTLE